MNFIALISGGKDSILSIKKCLDYGYNLVCLGNLYPVEKDELDSFMFQTVGHEVIEKIAESIGKPLVRQQITGSSLYSDTIDYAAAKKTINKTESDNETGSNSDEIDDLYHLLSKAKKQFPDLNSVSCGAILSDYQRLRLEYVAKKLNLTVLAPLWQYDQIKVLNELMSNKIEVIISKTASLGLNPRKHLGKTIDQMYPILCKLSETYGVNAAGEGGEFESLCLFCPGVYRKRIRIVECEILGEGDFDYDSGVAYLKLNKVELEDPEGFEMENTPQNIPKLIEKSEFLSDPDEEKLHKNYGFTYPPQSHHFKNSNLIVISNLIATLPKIVVKNTETISTAFKIMFAQLDVQLKLHKINKSHVCYVRLYISDMRNYAQINNEYLKYFPNEDAFFSPARACIEVAYDENSQKSGLLASMEIIACSDLTQKQVLHIESYSHWAPAMIGPYSQAVQVNKEYTFLAGMIGLEPFKMQMIEDPRYQQELAYNHVESVFNLINFKNAINLQEYNGHHLSILWYTCEEEDLHEIENNDLENRKKLRVRCNNLPKAAIYEYEDIFSKLPISVLDPKTSDLLNDLEAFANNNSQKSYSARLFLAKTSDPCQYQNLMKKNESNDDFSIKTMSLVPTLNEFDSAVLYEL